ncbi:hypothetical protein GVN24_34080 [Rhizobium sp. CRIBSB]|nr:hypothetical protein [Rhizobium sp. CRIBSB]
MTAGLVLLVVCCIGVLSHIPGQIGKDRAYERKLAQIASTADRYRAETGQLPEQETFTRLAGGSDHEFILVAPTPPSLCADFRMAPGDRFVVSSWRGDWAECLSHPSGQSTLGSSWQKWLPSVALYVLLIFASLWGMRRLWR